MSDLAAHLAEQQPRRSPLVRGALSRYEPAPMHGASERPTRFRSQIWLRSLAVKRSAVLAPALDTAMVHMSSVMRRYRKRQQTRG